MFGPIAPVILRGSCRPHVGDAFLSEGVTAEEVGWQPLCHALSLELVPHRPGAEGDLRPAFLPIAELIVGTVRLTPQDERNNVVEEWVARFQEGRKAGRRSPSAPGRCGTSSRESAWHRGCRPTSSAVTPSERKASPT